MKKSLIALFERDIKKVIKELNLYQNEANIWKTEGNISNSAGNLALHLIGNLNTYIGKEIGKTNYVRHRDLEFSLKNVPREEIVSQLEETLIIVKDALENLTEQDYLNEYPVLVFEEKTNYEYFLIHLTTHLGYHLGQINYHRRLIDV